MRLPGAPTRIVAAAVLLTLMLVGLVVREGMARAQGQEVRLAITGYDPRSLLSGHYVRFLISEDTAGEASCPPGADGITPKPKGWVALSRRGDRHAATGAATSRAGALELGELAVSGTLTCLGTSVALRVPGQPEAVSPMAYTASLDIGIDRLYLDQVQAEALEMALRGRGMDAVPAFAIVSVGRDGKARLKGLSVNGRRIDLDWF